MAALAVQLCEAAVASKPIVHRALLEPVRLSVGATQPNTSMSAASSCEHLEAAPKPVMTRLPLPSLRGSASVSAHTLCLCVRAYKIRRHTFVMSASSGGCKAFL